MYSKHSIKRHESAMICVPGKNSSALIPRVNAPPINKNERDVMSLGIG